MRPPINTRAQGAALLIALIVLAVLTVATAGLTRSIDTANLLAGNLAFKRASLSAADLGAEQAIAWISDRADTLLLDRDDAGAGYYASTSGEWDMTGNQEGNAWSRVDWDDDQCARGRGVVSVACARPSPALVLPDLGNTVRYVIHRLCTWSGPSSAAENQCQMHRPPTGTTAVYYRITVSVRGPRNTRSYTETVVRF